MAPVPQHRSTSGNDADTTRRPRAIALVGIDGSGKTTQAHQLADLLTAGGMPATYWQNAGGRRWLGRLARRLGRRDPQHLLGRTGLLFVESVLRWLAIARALLRSTLRRRVAVMDRYAACQYASIRAHGGHRWEVVARAFYRIFPAPDVTFLLDVAPAEAYRRIEERGTDHESIEFLAASVAAYRSLPEHPRFVVVDANGTPAEVTAAILDHLAERFPVRPSTGPVAGPVDELPPPAGPAVPGPGVARIATRSA
ncbi:dTMP kinase [Polymorphospora rubra]|uniref:dTMP kinase n=1 Tax=Polymorphospora rubra TaxID=338584 RepID=UPI003F4CFF2A